ncbi:recombinase family protein [Mucilaginibacter sp. HD30]
MHDLAAFSAFAKGQATKTVTSSNCLIYTRVSSKEQADTNMSLTTQMKACSEYAERHGYNVLKNFGGTYESATTDDERKEFTAMLAYIKKSKERINLIITYSVDRFSRNANSIWLIGSLRKEGVEIVSVTQPIDTSNPSGQMQQAILVLFSEHDNQIRRQRCMAGTKEMLLRGDWPTHPVYGYSIQKIDGKRTIVPNQTAKLIRQAFHWKALDGLSNEAIREKLRDNGFSIPHQRLSEMLRNVFYCGLMSHKMLEGKVIKGNHEPLISQEIFLKANGMLAKNTQGYSITVENENLPLKRFLLCDKCGKSMRGYKVLKKGLHYYKCNTQQCCNNRRADELHDRFARILTHFTLDVPAGVLKLIKQQMIATFNQYTKDGEERYQTIKQQYAELEKKIYRLEERFIEEEISKDLYHKFNDKYSAEKVELNTVLEKASQKVSNLEECIQKAFDFSLNLPSRWLEADYSTKQKLQYLIFPNGIFYNKVTDRCRTDRVNSLFGFIAHFQAVTKNSKRDAVDCISFAPVVARRGIEPLLPE